MTTSFAPVSTPSAARRPGWGKVGFACRDRALGNKIGRFTGRGPISAFLWRPKIRDATGQRRQGPFSGYGKLAATRPLGPPIRLSLKAENGRPMPKVFSRRLWMLTPRHRYPRQRAGRFDTPRPHFVEACAFDSVSVPCGTTAKNDAPHARQGLHGRAGLLVTLSQSTARAFARAFGWRIFRQAFRRLDAVAL